MIAAWWRRRRRRKLLEQPFPDTWLGLIQRLSFYSALGSVEQERLRDITRVLVAEKTWEGCGGLRITDEMKVLIAAQAALLLLGIDHDHYSNVSTILVYPSSYVTGTQVDEMGVVGPGHVNLGEAWRRGPVVLTWDSVARDAKNGHDGRNLVYHEFAHKLDMLDGLADGTPPLRSPAQYREWVATMGDEFGRLRDASAHGEATLLDTYGATNPAEFFAVATECFFEQGELLRTRHPELHAVLSRYYGQAGASSAR